jgi:hypothetical protein
MIAQQATQTIYNSITPHGIVASQQDVGNYARVWSRDSMMTGLCGLLLNDATMIAAHKNSIFTLAKHQGEQGQLPSNVNIQTHRTEVSYGTLVGRVDATTWWLIGTLSYIIITKDDATFKTLESTIAKAFAVLDSWEYNGRGLLYTPLGGNWADEYICDGYTLYDNALRLWALKLMNKVQPSENYIAKQQLVHNLLINNFNVDNTVQERYHFIAYDNMQQQHCPYLPACLNANGYKYKFDMAGNAIALLMGVNTQPNALLNFLHQLAKEQGNWMLPVFHPIITTQHADWALLTNNYNYVFKNNPHHFHNGGSWPIFLGWLAVALHSIGQDAIPANMLKNYETVLNDMPQLNFKEYISTNQLEPSGTADLCFSAVGYLLLHAVSTNNLQNITQLL